MNSRKLSVDLPMSYLYPSKPFNAAPTAWRRPLLVLSVKVELPSPLSGDPSTGYRLAGAR
jgi:hypothetical protein